MATRRSISRHDRKLVAERAGYRCEYCLSPEKYSLDSFTIDHIIPVSRGGDNSLENLAYACHNCNNRKHDAITVTDIDGRQPVPFYNPRKDRWNDHFRWSSDLLTMVPLTPEARVTVKRFHLNRPGATNIRAALVALGEDHPPRSDQS